MSNLSFSVSRDFRASRKAPGRMQPAGKGTASWRPGVETAVVMMTVAASTFGIIAIFAFLIGVKSPLL
jgi:hypothetical protein